jgi:hypothetical protein
MVGGAHPWGLDIFSIQDKRVPIGVGIIIVVGVGIGIGIGIDPDTDSDPDTDGNQKKDRSPTTWHWMVGGAHPTWTYASSVFRSSIRSFNWLGVKVR